MKLKHSQNLASLEFLPKANIYLNQRSSPYRIIISIVLFHFIFCILICDEDDLGKPRGKKMFLLENSFKDSIPVTMYFFQSVLTF